MKILYGIQGTGNGHITVAREVLPILQRKAEVDVLVSGTQVDIDLPVHIKYRLNGLCFVFGKNGGIDYLETYKRGKIKQLFREIQELPVNDYDLVLSDFEPVTAWACQLHHKPCIGFSHQAAVINKHAPTPKKTDFIGRAVLKYYAPVTKKYGFHFLPYNKNIYTPIIRTEIRQKQVSDEGHYTVYLPAYSDKRILKILRLFPEVHWHVFSKHSEESYREENILVRPVSHEAFVDSMVRSSGVLCGAGFQTPSEVLFLKKKLLAVPMKGQYEQQCNAAALKLLGVPVIKNLKQKQAGRIKDWLHSAPAVVMDYPDETEYILDEIIERHARTPQLAAPADERLHSPSRFRDYLLKRIFYQTGV